MAPAAGHNEFYVNFDHVSWPRRPNFMIADFRHSLSIDVAEAADFTFFRENIWR